MEILEKTVREKIKRLHDDGNSWFDLALDIFNGEVSDNTLRAFVQGRKVKSSTLELLNYFLCKIK